jgi:hypothetical protein
VRAGDAPSFLHVFPQISHGDFTKQFTEMNFSMEKEMQFSHFPFFRLSLRKYVYDWYWEKGKRREMVVCTVNRARLCELVGFALVSSVLGRYCKGDVCAHCGCPVAR